MSMAVTTPTSDIHPEDEALRARFALCVRRAVKAGVISREDGVSVLVTAGLPRDEADRRFEQGACP